MSNSEIAQDLFILGSATAEVAGGMTDQGRLVERVRTGDREAFDEIYRMFAPLIHGVVLARVPQDEVQDIVQDVFLMAYNNIHTLRDKNAVGAWMLTIARNRSAEFYRRSRPTEELTDDIRGRSQPHAEAHEILSAIRSLPDTYRETLVLRLVEGMSGIEIAERTGMKPESVRVNLHRGMELLRQKLGIGGRK
ncbi:MAG TPA: sigma-70 family RNA polymerase sigma factor [Pyrinomonadaceae bacterium]|nr:sigma-70 family RNA polymerase sigma factor [Pyrinomonadaceae bacterium]